MPEEYHKSVLLSETIDSLNITEGQNRIFCDLTGGGGGHSAEVLKHLDQSDRLIVMDQDPDAIKVLSARFESDERVTVVCDNFSNFALVAESLGIKRNSVSGIIADIGCSSHQFDDPKRGFSYRFDGPLSMSMSQSGLTAADIVNSYSQQQLAKLLFEYADEKFANLIAKKIVAQREIKPFETTLELAECIQNAYPPGARRKSRHHVCKKSFNAIRREVNNEIGALQTMIDDCFDYLCVNGRLSIITFDSLEDRTVKLKFKSYIEQCTCPKYAPYCVCGASKYVKIFKPIKPCEKELEENPRSRSATLRTFMKLKEKN